MPPNHSCRRSTEERAKEDATILGTAAGGRISDIQTGAGPPLLFNRQRT